MPDKKNLILVGPMGAGKSAVGRQLALSLSKEFFDSDHTIVDRTGVDIAYIFEKEGEDGFRNRETQVLGELAQQTNIILSTGGGSLVRPENREIVSNAGVVIYLHASVNQQVSRTKKKENRPLLHTENPRAVLERLMQQREKHYREVSDIVVTTDGQRVESVVEQILTKLKITESYTHQTIEASTVMVHTKVRDYPIHIGWENLLKPNNTTDTEQSPCVVITDENLDQLYRNKIEAQLKPLAWLVIPASETSKSMQHYQWLLDQLLELQVKRDCQLIGIGGGVVGDLTGFVAATYMRGMRLTHVPTSLLAMVDSSIGGKTGINFSKGKNLVGSIYQPHTVITDLSFLKTLPQSEYISGLAEVVKYALIHKPEFFTYLEGNSAAIKNREPAILHKIVLECAESKAQIVAQDEQDFGIRMLLNLGHTFGHAIEKLQHYAGFSHGEAVAIGTCMAADTSLELGHLSADTVKRIKHLFKNLGLKTTWKDFSINEFIQAMSVDKKNTSSTQRFILLKAIGEAYIEEALTVSILEKVLHKYSKSA